MRHVYKQRNGAVKLLKMKIPGHIELGYQYLGTESEFNKRKIEERKLSNAKLEMAMYDAEGEMMNHPEFQQGRLDCDEGLAPQKLNDIYNEGYACQMNTNILLDAATGG